LLTAHRDVRVRTSLGPTGIVIAALAALGIAAAFVSPSFAYTVAQPVQRAMAPIVRHRIAVRHYSEPKPQLPVTAGAAIAKATSAPTTPATAPATAVAKTSAPPVVKATIKNVEKTETLTSMKVAGNTMQNMNVPEQVAANSPAYIDELAAAGYTNLTIDQLIQLRSLGVTADYIRGLEDAGLQHPSVRDLTQMRALGVQPDFVRTMRQHFGALDVEQLCRLKALGVTPEYADQMMRAYPTLSVDDLARLRALGIDAAFVERANAHGFHNLSVEQLIRLKTSGIL
jgi:hypothetical protein